MERESKRAPTSDKAPKRASRTRYNWRLTDYNAGLGEARLPGALTVVGYGTIAVPTRHISGVGRKRRGMRMRIRIRQLLQVCYSGTHNRQIKYPDQTMPSCDTAVMHDH